MNYKDNNKIIEKFVESFFEKYIESNNPSETLNSLLEEEEFKDEFSLEEISKIKEILDPLTKIHNIDNSKKASKNPKENEVKINFSNEKFKEIYENYPKNVKEEIQQIVIENPVKEIFIIDYDSSQDN